jgi:hypothetical protein
MSVDLESEVQLLIIRSCAMCRIVGSCLNVEQAVQQ